MLAGLPVTAPFAISIPREIAVSFCSAYEAVMALTLMMAMRGSSGPPSWMPSPRSPIQAFRLRE